RGIDRAAHEGALQTGDTIAVLGSGIDRVYPADRPDLIARMLERGGLFMSELLPWTGPEPANFPMRNRLIAGLARAVVVVEAGQKSGALITAACALAENRAVYAVPGSVFSPVSVGCNALLQAGAQVCCTAADVLEECGKTDVGHVRADNAGVSRCRGATGRSAYGTDTLAAAALRELATGPMTPGALQAAIGCSAQDLLALLTRLELAGDLIRDGVGRVFVCSDMNASLHTSNSE
ncbi:MAG: DNA-processing protein DprA, partial [Firmicutes bacterium]|nr:DNA-processing protein DprA [Bacillota bacterium]